MWDLGKTAKNVGEGGRGTSPIHDVVPFTNAQLIETTVASGQPHCRRGAGQFTFVKVSGIVDRRNPPVLVVATRGRG